MFKEYSYINDYEYTNGWDRYALDYEKLLVPNTVYYLTKQVMHHLVDQHKGTNRNGQVDVLDINCGTGNDFPFFFDRGWSVVGCDGSEGMLNRAYENYHAFINSGKLRLYSGMIEDIGENTFQPRQFDLIFSVTGGFSYVTDEQLVTINNTVSKFLKKDGVLIVAHLNKYCVPEMLYRLSHLKYPFYRMRNTLEVNIKGEKQIMYLRSVQQLKRLYSETFSEIRTLPLLSFTPPYQSGFSPGTKLLKKFRKLELKNINNSWLCHSADQVVTVCRNV